MRMPNNELRGGTLIKLREGYESIVALVVVAAALHNAAPKLGLSRRARRKLRKFVTHLKRLEDCLGPIHSEVARGYERDLTHPINIGDIGD